jgi:hypothetical protein
LPNIIQNINDLKSEGYPEVAVKLQKYLMKSAAAHNFRRPTRSIFQAMSLIHPNDMEEVEERIMQSFVELFDRFLGISYYNSFVMRMNLAQRQLLRNPRARLEDYIPSLSLFDELFSISDTRSLDIIRLRMEILYHRGEHEQTEVHAELLIQRASMKNDDVWQQLYFSIKGYYYLGLVQYLQRDHSMAKMNVLQCIQDIT